MTESKTILFIEDDHFISDMYSRALEREGYSVSVESSGEKGLAVAISQNFDIILLDIMVPDMDGRQVLDKLTEHYEGSASKPRIVIMTNFDQPDEAKSAMEAQADGYLIKADITPSDLLEVIKNLDK